ncbi:hypothetical protein HanPI659440_Chr00c20g0734711 [Helianthus annuus]|nr:hypothetical protein HanPI659440_Chr00c20g0734711 [Helianthus annuus]
MNQRVSETQHGSESYSFASDKVDKLRNTFSHNNQQPTRSSSKTTLGTPQGDGVKIQKRPILHKQSVFGEKKS